MGTIQNPSLPKDKIKILLLENISDTAVNALQGGGLYQPRAADEGAGRRRADRGARRRAHARHPLAHARSPQEIVGATDQLIAIGCFSVGTNQVDLDAARRKGIPVFNAPFSNTRSVAELTIAEIVMLYRRIFPALGRGPRGRLGQVGDRQPRGARQDARHRRLRQHRQPAVRPRRGDGHARDLLRSHRQAAARQRRADQHAGRTAGGRRRRHRAPAGDVGDHGHASAPRDRPHEEGRLPHQQCARHAGRSRTRWPQP